MDDSDSDDLLASGRYDWALSLLGIDRDAKVEEAKFAYRKLALRYHPDRNPGDKQAEEQFKKIDAAWKALEDILPPSPVPLEIPDGVSEQEMEAIYVKWLLQPDQPPRYKQSKAAAPPPQTETQDRHEWSTVASENTGKALTTWEGSPQKDWTRLWIKRGKASTGLESITADEAALLIYSRPHAMLDTSMVRWMPATNDSGQDIPAFAAVGVNDADGDGVLSLNQAQSDGEPVCFNGPFVLPAGGDGMVTFDGPMWAAYDSASGTPAFGDTWGVVGGTWKLAKGKSGYVYLAGADGSRGLFLPAAGGGNTDVWIKCTSQTATSSFYPGTLSKPTVTGWNDTSTAVSFLPLKPDLSPTVTPVIGMRYPAALISGTKYALKSPIVKCAGSLQVG